MRAGLKNLTAVALIGAAAFFLWMVHPAEHAFIPRCPLLQATGLYCPGCGSLRSIHYLLQGELAQAWAMNPMTVLLLPLLLVLAGAELIFRRYDLAHRIPVRLIWLMLAVYILFGILRNIPMPPFTLLAPH